MTTEADFALCFGPSALRGGNLQATGESNANVLGHLHAARWPPPSTTCSTHLNASPNAKYPAATPVTKREREEVEREVV